MLNSAGKGLNGIQEGGSNGIQEGGNGIRGKEKERTINISLLCSRNGKEDIARLVMTKKLYKKTKIYIYPWI